MVKLATMRKAKAVFRLRFDKDVVKEYISDPNEIYVCRTGFTRNVGHLKKDARQKTTSKMTERDKKEKRRDVMINYLGLTILLFLGAFLVYCYFLIDTSEEINKYLNVSAGGSSLRFIAFIGIVKYGLIFVGSSLIIISSIKLITQKKEENAI